MKTIKLKLLTSILSVLLLTLFYSCRLKLEPTPIEIYKGGVVYKKENTPTGGMTFMLKVKDKKSRPYFKTVYVLEVDWNRYFVGDTIK